MVSKNIDDEQCIRESAAGRSFTLTDLSTLTTMTEGTCIDTEAKSNFGFNTAYTYDSATSDASSVSDIVKKTVALSTDTQALCVSVSRRLQSSGRRQARWRGKLTSTCSSFSTAEENIKPQ